MTKDDVFQFVFVRPPQKADREKEVDIITRYDKSKKTSLHKQIEEIFNEPDAFNKTIQLAHAFIASDDYISEHPVLVNTIRKASNSKTIENSNKLIVKGLGRSASDYLALAETIRLKERVWNSLYV